MRNRLAWVAALGLLPFAGCGSPTPCSGDTCLQIAGTYLVVLAEQVNCTIWAKNVPPSSVMVITQNGSSISAQLWPNTDDPHIFTGTLYTNNSMNVGESQQNQLLGIPYGTITGTFSSTSTVAGQPPYYFSGQIFLQGGGSQATSSGGTQGGGPPSTGCSAMNAPEHGGPASTAGGTDAGGGQDAGGDAG